MTRDEAYAVATALEIATDLCWPEFCAQLRDRGVSISHLVSGWEETVSLGGLANYVPEVEDFE
jgi:hypothetical protein